jgi:hypothetical protein
MTLTTGSLIGIPQYSNTITTSNYNHWVEHPSTSCGVSLYVEKGTKRKFKQEWSTIPPITRPEQQPLTSNR